MLKIYDINNHFNFKPMCLYCCQCFKVFNGINIKYKEATSGKSYFYKAF